MRHKILYLGLNPPPGVVHYPVIRIEKLTNVKTALDLWPRFSHVIFTSKTAVGCWFEEITCFDKVAIAIGPATASVLQARGVRPLVASNPTQEGIVELLRTQKPSFVFLPRSKKARSVLTDYLRKRKIPFFALDLYDTVLQKLEPVPNLDEIDEIVFTSPSTVEGFLAIYGRLPMEKVLTTIGPVTAQKLNNCCYKYVEKRYTLLNKE